MLPVSRIRISNGAIRGMRLRSSSAMSVRPFQRGTTLQTTKIDRANTTGPVVIHPFSSSRRSYSDASKSFNGRSFQKIKEDFQESAMSFEHPADLITLLGYIVNVFAPIRICIEAGIFKILASSQEPMTASQLARKLNGVPKTDTEDAWADREEFIDRMLRAVCGLNLADETGPHTYQANELTVTMADPGFDLGFQELYDTALGPKSTITEMVKWAREKTYRAPERSTDGPFQQARGIVGTTTFQYFVNDAPHLMSNLSALMKVIQKDRLNWSAWFSADALFSSVEASKADEVFMVDVGGGLGHDLMGLAGRYPEKQIKLVVEDQPSVIAETREQKLDSRIDLVEQDFFQAQKIKGAKIYFMHKIMHDWPDAECVEILTHLRDAMASDSRIFINDVILADQGNPLIYSAFDICMFVQLSAKERSESMWRRLIGKVGGLEVKKFWQAPGLKGEGIVEVVKTS